MSLVASFASARTQMMLLGPQINYIPSKSHMIVIKTLHNIFNRKEKSAFITSVQSIYKHGLGPTSCNSHYIYTTYTLHIYATYGSREGTIQKYFANPKKYFKSQYYSQITVEKFDKSKKLLQIPRKFVDPQITFSI